MSNAIVEDCIAPRMLIIPSVLNGAATPKSISGAIWFSGAKLYFSYGNSIAAITSV